MEPTGMHRPKRLEEIRQTRKPPRDVNAQHQGALTPLEKIALAVTTRIGTMGFFFCIVGWTAFWLGWNWLAPPHLRFDPPMGFVFWLFISNMIQIFLMPLLMIGQNLQSRHAELGAESHLEAHSQAEIERDQILHHLEHQEALLIALAKKTDIDVEKVLAESHHNGSPDV